MIAVVTDSHGKVLVETDQRGGSSNTAIAEFLAVKEAIRGDKCIGLDV